MNRFLLEWVPWIFNKTSIALDIAVRALTAAYTEVSVEKEWLLLHSIQIPLSSMTFPTVPSEQIQWRVKTNPTRFLDSSNNSEYIHISHLGMTVKLSSSITVDLTDWINEVKWSGSVAPTPKELFTIWCCETGSPYLHLMPTAEYTVITESGDTVNGVL